MKSINRKQSECDENLTDISNEEKVNFQKPINFSHAPL